MIQNVNSEMFGLKIYSSRKTRQVIVCFAQQLVDSQAKTL